MILTYPIALLQKKKEDMLVALRFWKKYHKDLYKDSQDRIMGKVEQIDRALERLK